MSKIYKGVSELIGKTPIIEAVNFEKAVEADATILAKLEYFNPAGSVKDISLICTPESFRKPPSMLISPNSFSMSTSFSP